MSWVISLVCPAPMFWYLTFRYVGSGSAERTTVIVPQLSWVNTSVEKAKTDRHDSARDRLLFATFFESLKTYATSGEEPALSGQGVDSAPKSVCRTPGAAPTILEFLWLSESDKAL